MYADRVTKSMKAAIDETNRRRALQAKYNAQHGITPRTVARAILDMKGSPFEADYKDATERAADNAARYGVHGSVEFRDVIDKMKKDMHRAADDMDFERAAELRDKIKELESLELAVR
jgi:excinuclease ABC subunit B